MPDSPTAFWMLRTFHHEAMAKQECGPRRVSFRGHVEASRKRRKGLWSLSLLCWSPGTLSIVSIILVISWKLLNPKNWK